MASTTFVDYSNATPITAAWLNDVNRLQYTILGNPADRAGYIALDTAHAGGTADAITAAFSVSLSALTDGLTYYVRATAANATATPTFTPNAGVITPATIVRQLGVSLLVGDIPAAGYWMALQYDTTLTKWVLLNPAYSIPLGTSGQTLTMVSGKPVWITPSAFSAYQSSAQSVSANTNTTILFQTKDFDVGGEYNATTGVFTAASAGIYEFGAQVVGTQNTTATTWNLSLLKNGATTYLIDYNGFAISSLNGQWTRKGTLLLNLAANDTISVQYNISVADTLNNGAHNTVFWGKRIL